MGGKGVCHIGSDNDKENERNKIKILLRLKDRYDIIIIRIDKLRLAACFRLFVMDSFLLYLGFPDAICYRILWCVFAITAESVLYACAL